MPDVKTAQPEAARRLARALKLPFAEIRCGASRGDENHVAFPLHDRGVPVRSLLVPAGLPRPTLRRLRDRVVPSLEVLLQAARERQRVTDEQAALRRLATLVARGAPRTRSSTRSHARWSTSWEYGIRECSATNPTPP